MHVVKLDGDAYYNGKACVTADAPWHRPSTDTQRLALRRAVSFPRTCQSPVVESVSCIFIERESVPVGMLPERCLLNLLRHQANTDLDAMMCAGG